MAVTTYTFSIQDDTANGAVNLNKLTSEIAASTIITALDHIGILGDVLDIYFKDALSTGDETTLGTVVAAHDGEPLPNDEISNVKISGDPLTSDGKQFTHETSRVLGTYTYWSGASDQQSDQTLVGNDDTNVLYLNMPSGTNEGSVYIDLIIENKTYLHEGYFQWSGCQGDIIKMEIVPRVTPSSAGTATYYNALGGYLIIPAAGDGTLVVADEDRVLIQNVPNEFGTMAAGFWNADWNSSTKEFENITAAPSGDGVYNMFSVEVTLSRFCNWIPAIGSGFIMLQSADVSEIGHGVRMKMTAKTKGANHAWSCASFITFNRVKTC